MLAAPPPFMLVTNATPRHRGRHLTTSAHSPLPLLLEREPRPEKQRRPSTPGPGSRAAATDKMAAEHVTRGSGASGPPSDGAEVGETQSLSSMLVAAFAANGNNS